MEIIKSNTGKALKIKFAFLKRVYWDDKGIWVKGNFVSTVEINEKIIKEYIKKCKRWKIQGKRSLNFPENIAKCIQCNDRSGKRISVH